MADDSRKQIRGRMKTCPVCGREFWCYDPVLWAYRERTGGARYICSWGCQVKHNTALEEKRTARKKCRVPSETTKLWNCIDQAEIRKRTARARRETLKAIEAKRTEPEVIEPKETEPKAAKKRVEYHWLVNLAEIMREKGVSDRTLAKSTGIRRATIGQWRRADTRCPEYKIDMLVEALGVSREEVLVSDIRPDVEPVVKKSKEEKPPKEWHWLVNLGKIMQERGMSDRDLSKLSGIKRGTIAQWRRLGAKCQRDKLDMLAEALGVSWEAITEKKNGVE